MLRFKKPAGRIGLLFFWFVPALSALSQPITEFPVGGLPRRIIPGPDGKLWFSSLGSANIGTIDTAGAAMEIPAPGSAGLTVQDLAFDSAENLWFTEDLKIGLLRKGGLLVEFSLPVGSRAFGITIGPDGNAWFTEPTNKRIGRISQTGLITEFDVFTGPFAITVGPDENLWFTEAGGLVGRITPTGVVAEFAIGSDRNSYAAGEAIASGPDGAIWFIEPAGRIGRITTSGISSEFTIPRFQGQELGGIVSGPDGNLWFTEGASPVGPRQPLPPSKIGRITPAGVITEFFLPDPFSHPVGIASGPDGNLWIAELYAKKIARVAATLVPCERCIRQIPFRW